MGTETSLPARVPPRASTTEPKALLRADSQNESDARLTVTPVTLAEANKYIAQHHRHHRPVVGHLVCCAVSDDAGEIRGVGIAGRPVSRMLQDGFTAEVTRCCSDGARNACSMLYRALWRAVRALGYRRLVTYTLPQEGGASLRGAGFRLIGEAGGGSWSRTERPRVDLHPTQEKLRWEVVA